MYRKLPDLDAIALGKKGIPFPDEPSVRYAVTIGLTIRASDPERANKIMEWASQEAPSEWFQLLASDILKSSRKAGFGDTLVWTCNGFAPVTYLIMPPLLRTPAG